MKLTKRQQEKYTRQMEKYKKQMVTLVDKMLTMTSTLPYKGDICEDSQKVCLIVAINEVDHCLNGLKLSDFTKEEDDDDGDGDD
jgi:hypothetical protein